MNGSIIPEHDTDICEGPPEIPSEDHEEEKCEYEVYVSEWSEEVGEHVCWNV